MKTKKTVQSTAKAAALKTSKSQAAQGSKCDSPRKSQTPAIKSAEDNPDKAGSLHDTDPDESSRLQPFVEALGTNAADLETIVLTAGADAIAECLRHYGKVDLPLKFQIPVGGPTLIELFDSFEMVARISDVSRTRNQSSFEFCRTAIVCALAEATGSPSAIAVVVASSGGRRLTHPCPSGMEPIFVPANVAQALRDEAKVQGSTIDDVAAAWLSAPRQT